MTSPYAHPDYLQGLAAVRAEPDEDGPRLMLADWLDDHGDPARGEFVRVQCGLSRLEAEEGCDRETEPDECRPFILESKCGPCRRKHPLRCREHDLLTGYAARWLPAGGPHALSNGPRVPFSFPGQARRHYEGRGATAVYSVGVFRRGFMEELTCVAADWMAHADALVPRCVLRRVALTDRPSVAELARIFVPSAARFRRVAWPETLEVDAPFLLSALWPGVEFEVPPAFDPDEHPRDESGR